MEYSLKRINQIGIVEEVVSVNVVSDALALAWARMFSLGKEVEVWRGSRQLTTIPPSGTYPPTKPGMTSTL